MNRILLVGFGGRARSVANMAIASGFEELLFADKRGEAGQRLERVSVAGEIRQEGQ